MFVTDQIVTSPSEIGLANISECCQNKLHANPIEEGSFSLKHPGADLLESDYGGIIRDRPGLARTKTFGINSRSTDKNN